GPRGAAAGGPPPVHPHQPRRAVGAARRAHAGGAGGGGLRGELQPGRRIPGHLGAEARAMISRGADHRFWLGRYLERVESTGRVLYVTQTLAGDAELSPRQCWQPVVIVSGESEPFAARFGADATGDGEVVQRYMTWDLQNLSSIQRSVGAARENARS